MPRHTRGRFHGGAGLATSVVAAMIVAACGGTAASSVAPTARPVTAAPSPTARPVPSVAASVAPSEAAALPRHGRIDIASDGYGVTLPDNWFRIDLTKADIDAFVKAGKGGFGPGMTDQLANQLSALVSQGISLFAYRFADEQAGLGTNLNVLVLPSGGMDIDALENLNIGQLQSIVGKDVTIAHTREKLPAGDAIRIAYTIPASTTTNGQTVALIQHLVLAPDKQLVLTCTAPGGIDKIADECDTIAKSVEFL